MRHLCGFAFRWPVPLPPAALPGLRGRLRLPAPQGGYVSRGVDVPVVNRPALGARSLAASQRQAPRMYAICKRVGGTLRREFLDRIVIIGERYLTLVLREYGPITTAILEEHGPKIGSYSGSASAAPPNQRHWPNPA